MGVPSFYRWIENNNHKNAILINDEINNCVDYLMLDANCLLHPCVAYIIEKCKENEITNIKTRDEVEILIWNKIEEYINNLIEKVKPKNLFIAVDGVAPMGKIIQQRQRRYKNSNMEISKLYPIQSIELTPSTPYMKRLHLKLEEYCKKLKIKNIYSSCYECNEGEHKIMQYIKNNIEKDKTIVIYGLDADLLFLSLTDNLKHNLFVMREKQFFDKMENENNDLNNVEEMKFNYVNINEFHEIINNYGISSNDFVVLCFLLGNDFLPSILSLNIKRKGIEHLLSAYRNVIKTKKMKFIENEKINYLFLFEIFKNIEWTEKKVFQYNTTFDNEEEYYRYYLNKHFDFKEQKKKMVQEYIKTIEWCFHYYNKKCISWKHYYNYDCAPLIKDIIQFFPEHVVVDIYDKPLKPIEQLILVIPSRFYNYAIENDILKKILKNKYYEKIKFLLPNEFIIDSNKESIEWKQNAILPFINYDYYIHNINKIL